MYDKIRDNISSHLDHETTDSYSCLYEEFSYEDQCVKAIFCNDKIQVIRYVVIYGVSTQTDINALILWNSSYW